jgi:hypothetical protein
LLPGTASDWQQQPQTIKDLVKKKMEKLQEIDQKPISGNIEECFTLLLTHLWLLFCPYLQMGVLMGPG